MQKTLSRVLAVFLIACILVAVLPSVASAKDYYFPKVVVTISIQKDGSFDVVENRTYNFSGDFHWATYTLEKSGFERLDDFSVEDENGKFVQNSSGTPGTFNLTETASRYTATFYYAASDTQKTFTFSYKVIGGIKSYSDVADFYWKLIGTGWDKKTSVFEGYVYFPEDVPQDDFYVFGHGPLNGEVEKIGTKGASYKATNVPPNTFVEARIIFPSSILIMPRENISEKDTILKEEVALANKTNAQKRNRLFELIILILIPIVMFFYWLYLFFKFGREYPPTREIVYEREIPEEIPPAIVGYLLRFKNIEINDFTATIMNLVRKGYISMQSVNEEKGLIFKRNVPVIYLTKTDKSIEGLSNHEVIVYDFLFSSVTYDYVASVLKDTKIASVILNAIQGKKGALPGMAGTVQNTVSTEDIKEYIKTHSKEFTALFESFKAAVKEEGDQKGYFESMPPQVILFIALAFIIPFAMFFVVTKFALTFLIPYYIISSAVLIILVYPLGRRTQNGADAYAEWNGLRKFLKDFSSLASVVPASIVLWEAYLVYSVTFGISKRVIEQMKIALPNIPENELRTSHFFASQAALGNVDIAASFGSIVDSMVTSFNSISTTAASSGGGGGFSGGGGGGGGGSGGGAG
ncbi:MAG: DUF2207 domain-containing protein [Caldisericaceae bacterium]